MEQSSPEKEKTTSNVSDQLEKAPDASLAATEGRRILIKNLASAATESDLLRFFSGYSV